jgi:hypothetical protein
MIAHDLVRESAGWWWRPAADGRLWPVSCEDAGPQVIVVVRCNLVVCGPDVAPMWPSGQELGRLSATHGLPSLGERWLCRLIAHESLDPEISRGSSAKDQRENNDPGHRWLLPSS